MPQVFTIKRGDRLPAISAVLRDADGNEANLAVATEVRFLMRGRAGGALKVNGVATAAGATATYAWAAGDTDTAGLYHAEFQVTWADGKPQTFPNGEAIQVRVNDDLGP